jgi:NADPH-dependent glutamate synthase beta subunit-like oxidoreductase/Pyruvate/2-oxoacid:ferredoxin oxidoreductase delta subunit/ferredoxin
LITSENSFSGSGVLEEITFYVDGHEVTAKQGETILEASLAAGIYIPHICYHENLNPAGSCRLCMVEIEGLDGIYAACTTRPKEGMQVVVHGEKADKVRNLSMALLFSVHPEECVTCPKYLKCQLQALSQYLNAPHDGIRRRTNSIAADNRNPLMLHEMFRCILCGRCVRVCNDVRGVGALKFEKVDGNLRVVIDGKTMEEAGCQFCGACVEVCPTGSIRDQPGVFNFEKPREESLVPCKSRCPAGVDVPRYIRFARQGNYSAASAVVRERAVFAEMLGYVCTHFCELACKRRFLNEAVGICRIKQYACANADGEWKKRGFKKQRTNKKAAIIGAGPAGMTAAYYLQKCGHGVVVFEKEEAVGGTARYGIPEYRLPRHIIEREADVIRELGVIIKTGTAINSTEELLREGFDAVLVAIGTGQGVKLPIDGGNARGVLINTEFLIMAAKHQEIPIGRKVVVLGGGNVACDCAGMSLKLGAKEVYMACLESRETIPASAEELEEVEREGVIVHTGVTFDRILTVDGKVSGVVFSKVKSFTFDENRRAIIEKEKDSEYILAADTVIFAVGQRPIIPAGFDIRAGKGSLIAVTGQYTTEKAGVFAAGDAVTGTSSVVQAIAEARKAAACIDRFFGGNGIVDEVLAPAQEASDCIGKRDNIAVLERQTFCLQTECLTEKTVHCETERCLQCDLRLRIAPQKFWNDYTVT